MYKCRDAAASHDIRAERSVQCAKVRIVTHSGCDISFAEAEANGIVMLPDLVIFGSEQYRNNIDIHSDEFYRRLDSDPHFPTSAPQSVRFYGRVSLRGRLRGHYLHSHVLTDDQHHQHGDHSRPAAGR